MNKTKKEFKREDRYIVIKKKNLSELDLEIIDQVLDNLSIQTVECVVVEEDWPEYELVWNLIQSRMERKA